MSPSPHSHKEIRKAIKDAEKDGWTLVYVGNGHTYGRLYCPAKIDKVVVASTPRNPETIAKRIREAIKRCDHTPPKKKTP